MARAVSIMKPLFTWRSALCDSDMPPVTRHVALSLSLYMSERGDSAFPGAERLAHDTGHHVSTVRRALKDLVAEGWLELVEAGGMKGEKRHANVYRATVPLAHNDPLPFATGSPPLATPSTRLADPSPTATPSLQELTTNSSGGGPDERVAKLVAGFVDDYRLECHGHDPPRRFRDAAGQSVKSALRDGEDPEDIARCLGVIAHEGKNPSNLAYVLGDYHANRPRRTR